MRARTIDVDILQETAHTLVRLDILVELPFQLPNRKRMLLKLTIEQEEVTHKLG
jgi:hypothetical protein